MTKETLQQEVDQAALEATAAGAARIIKAFTDLETIEEYGVKERKRVNELVASRKAMFAEAMAVGHSTVTDQLLKLGVVEQRWQELEEAHDEKKDVMGTVKDQVKSTRQKIKDLLAEAKSNQLSMFQSPAEAAGDGDAVDDDVEPVDD